MAETTGAHGSGDEYPPSEIPDAPRRADVGDPGTGVAEALAIIEETSSPLHPAPAEPKEIATLPPIPVLRNEHPTSPRTGEPVRPAVVLVAMIGLLASAAGVALTYAVHWWAAAHPATYPTSANLVRWAAPEPGKWLSLTLEGVLAIVAAAVAGFSGYVGHHAWHGWRWTRWGAAVAVAANALVVVLFGWWGLVGVAPALVACVLLFLPRATEFFRQFAVHRGETPATYSRPERIFYGRLPRYR